MVNLNNLFLIIEKKGLSASKVSADTGISTGNISDWKKGRSMPTAIKLDILANYFECSIDYLLGRTDNPNVSGNYINGDNNVQAIKNNGAVTISQSPKAEQQDEMTQELVKAFCKLCFSDKMKIMNTIMKMVEE